MTRGKANRVIFSLTGMTLLLCWVFALSGCLPSHAVPDNFKGGAESAAGLPGSTELIDYGNRVIDMRVMVPEGMSQDDVTRRPFLYWRAWANQKIPFMRAFLFLLFTLNVANFVAQRVVADAVTIYRNKWLRSFGIGMLVFTIGLLGAGMMSRIGIFAPLGTGLVIVVQLASLLGLTIAANSIGDAILRAMRLENKIAQAWLRGVVTVAIGAFVLSLLVLVPGAGALPRMGARMLSLVAAAGAGAFILACRQRRAAQG